MINQIMCFVAVIRMDRTFSTHGISLIVRSNNDPLFSSDEIKGYMEGNSIKHYRITPLVSRQLTRLRIS